MVTARKITKKQFVWKKKKEKKKKKFLTASKSQLGGPRARETIFVHNKQFLKLIKYLTFFYFPYSFLHTVLTYSGKVCTFPIQTLLPAPSKSDCQSFFSVNSSRFDADFWRIALMSWAPEKEVKKEAIFHKVSVHNIACWWVHIAKKV